MTAKQKYFAYVNHAWIPFLEPTSTK